MKTLKYYNFVIICLLLTSLSSCMDMGLDELPVYTDAEITSFKFEYRYKVAVGTSGEKMQVRDLTTALSIDKDNNTVTCAIEVPGVYGTFTAEEKANVSLSNITGIAGISTAATITPLKGAPKLGLVADFSAGSFQYEVVAADKKNRKTWTVVITNFTNK